MNNHRAYRRGRIFLLYPVQVLKPNKRSNVLLFVNQRAMLVDLGVSNLSEPSKHQVIGVIIHWLIGHSDYRNLPTHLKYLEGQVEDLKKG